MSILKSVDSQATEQVLTPTEVATLLRCSQGTVYRLIRDGNLPAFRVGRVYRISLPLLRHWIEIQSRPERDAWGRSLEAVSEAMRQEILSHIPHDSTLGTQIDSALARVRASAS
ncbi:MAG: helix-turn-helix domain-containing protein [Chloroflexi bacterium]|nr:helix-turn-helix domain-containing protein [Chloroflexota bacterium]